jgi:hypothetical protein
MLAGGLAPTFTVSLERGPKPGAAHRMVIEGVGVQTPGVEAIPYYVGKRFGGRPQLGNVGDELQHLANDHVVFYNAGWVPMFLPGDGEHGDAFPAEGSPPSDVNWYKYEAPTGRARTRLVLSTLLDPDAFGE